MNIFVQAQKYANKPATRCNSFIAAFILFYSTCAAGLTTWSTDKFEVICSMLQRYLASPWDCPAWPTPFSVALSFRPDQWYVFVHLLWQYSAHAVYLVRRGHFWSRDEDCGHTIRSAVVEDPMAKEKFTALWLIEPELLPMEVLHCGNRNSTFLAPVTLNLIRWPSYTNLTRNSRYTGCANINFLCQSFRKLLSDRQADTTENIYHAASWVVNKVTCKK